MTRISLNIPESLKSALDLESRRAGVTRSELARTAIAECLARKERERYIAQFVAEARAGYANQQIREEALAIAEEFLY